MQSIVQARPCLGFGVRAKVGGCSADVLPTTTARKPSRRFVFDVRSALRA